MHPVRWDPLKFRIGNCGFNNNHPFIPFLSAPKVRPIRVPFLFVYFFLNENVSGTPRNPKVSLILFSRNFL
jgi:hypothetical protein